LERNLEGIVVTGMLADGKGQCQMVDTYQVAWQANSALLLIVLDTDQYLFS